jgi:hypothetical protein
MHSPFPYVDEEIVDFIESPMSRPVPGMRNQHLWIVVDFSSSKNLLDIPWKAFYGEYTWILNICFSLLIGLFRTLGTL